MSPAFLSDQSTFRLSSADTQVDTRDVLSAADAGSSPACTHYMLVALSPHPTPKSGDNQVPVDIANVTPAGGVMPWLKS